MANSPDNSVKITKAVIPVAGDGNRLMPLTLCHPKGMVAVVDKPVVHYILEDLASAGISHVIFVTAPNQPQFKKYTEYLLGDPKWKKVKIKFDFVVQKIPLGNGDALLPAEKLLNREPFLVYFCDYVLVGGRPSAKVFVELFEKVCSPIVALEHVQPEWSVKYSTVRAIRISGGLYRVEKIIEKPKPEQIISPWSVMPCYALTHEIFPFIQKAKNVFSDKKEIAIADALDLFCEAGNILHAWKYHGRRFDAGSKIGLLEANICLGLKHPEFGKELRKFLMEELK